MDDWDGFYTLTGGTAGTLIGLIFVVITLGMEHAKEGDTDRTRLFVSPILVYFATLLMIALAMVPPLSPIARALALGVIGCAGLGYVLNLAFLLRQRPDEREMLWDILLPMVSYALVAISAAAWALEASFANMAAAIAVAVLLVAALRKSWIVTLVIASRRRSDAPDA